MNTVNIVAWQWNDKCCYWLSYSFSFSFFNVKFWCYKVSWFIFELLLYALRPIKFTTFIDESVGKIDQFPAHTGDLKSNLTLNWEKKIFRTKIHIFFVIIRFSCRPISFEVFRTKIYIFFEIIRFSCRSISFKVFKEVYLFSFAFQVCYVCTKNPPKLFYR